MQQHDSSLRDPSAPVIVGIDVSKATLDCHIDPIGRRFQAGNDADGIAKLLTVLRPLKVELIVIEATGRLHRRLAAELVDAGLPVALVNPERARSFARSIGRLEKNDRVDAEVLARFGRSNDELRRMEKVPEQQLELDDLVSRRRALVAMAAAEKNRLAEQNQPKLARQQAHKLVRVLEQQVEDLDRAIAAMIDQDDGWKRKREIITSIPGVAEGTANQLLADLPELGKLNRQAIAKLAGVAPLADDSGPRRGQRHIKGGRKQVRNALYMAAFNAVRWCDRFKQYAKKLTDAGKARKVMLTAAMRKLLVTLNQMIKTDSLYQPS